MVGPFFPYPSAFRDLDVKQVIVFLKVHYGFFNASSNQFSYHEIKKLGINKVCYLFVLSPRGEDRKIHFLIHILKNK